MSDNTSEKDNNPNNSSDAGVFATIPSRWGLESENSDHQSSNLIACLESAVKAGNEASFYSLLEELKWESHSVEGVIKVIQLALEVGAYLVARQLSSEGVKRYPENSEMQKYARILASPKVKNEKLPPDLGIKANQDWLKQHQELYREKWVGLKDGTLLGAAKSLDELVQKIKDIKGVLLTFIY